MTAARRRAAPGLFLFLFIFIGRPPLVAQPSPLWGSLKAGKYPIGFRTFYRFEYGRVYKPKVDLTGRAREGERARPMQISVWYPAAVSRGASRGVFGRYVELLATEEREAKITDSLRKVAKDLFLKSSHEWLGETPENTAVGRLLNIETAAVWDADPAAGRFPVIILAQGSSQSAFTHAILCEYLASYGFVVATSPSMGPQGREMPDDLRGAETQERDMEFVIYFLSGGPVADVTRIGIAGFSFGGNASLLEAMKNSDVCAVMSMDSNIGYQGALDFLKSDPDFSVERMGLPLLHFSRKDVPGLDDRLLDTLRYADRTIIRVDGLTHFDFSSYGMITAMVPGFVKSARPNQKTGYETLCGYTLAFFREWLTGDKNDHHINENLDSSARSPGMLMIERKKGEKGPPSYEEFVDLIRKQGIDRARELFASERKRVPGASLFQETTVNRLGYEFLYSYQSPKTAIEIFRWNVDAYPLSFNVYDSLGESYLAEGRRALAVANYRKSLELNPGNTNAINVLKRIEAEK